MKKILLTLSCALLVVHFVLLFLLNFNEKFVAKHLILFAKEKVNENIHYEFNRYISDSNMSPIIQLFIQTRPELEEIVNQLPFVITEQIDQLDEEVIVTRLANYNGVPPADFDIRLLLTDKMYVSNLI